MSFDWQQYAQGLTKRLNEAYQKEQKLEAENKRLRELCKECEEIILEWVPPPHHEAEKELYKELQLLDKLRQAAGGGQ